MNTFKYLYSYHYLFVEIHYKLFYLINIKGYAMVGRGHNFSLIILEDVKIFMLQILKEHDWTVLWFYVNIAPVSNYRTGQPSCFHHYLVYCKSNALIWQLGKSKLKLIAYRNWFFFFSDVSNILKCTSSTWTSRLDI